MTNVTNSVVARVHGHNRFQGMPQFWLRVNNRRAPLDVKLGLGMNFP
jgi:hypothetical protein